MSMSEADARKRTSGSDANGPDEGHVTREQWKSTALAAMANYIDAGSIVAGAAGLALWSNLFHMSHTVSSQKVGGAGILRPQSRSLTERAYAG